MFGIGIMKKVAKVVVEAVPEWFPGLQFQFSCKKRKKLPFHEARSKKLQTAAARLYLDRL